jgi:hypothetical protein
MKNSNLQNIYIFSNFSFFLWKNWNGFPVKLTRNFQNKTSNFKNHNVISFSTNIATFTLFILEIF